MSKLTLVSPNRAFVFFDGTPRKWLTEPIFMNWDKAIELMFEDYGLNVYTELGKRKGVPAYIDLPKEKTMEQLVADVQMYLLEMTSKTAHGIKAIDKANVLIYNWPKAHVDSMREFSSVNMDHYFNFMNYYLAHR